MDDYSSHFDIFDSLNYLIPPVRKSNRTLGEDSLFKRDFQKQTDIRLIEDFRKKITRGIIISPSILHLPDVQSSSSVIVNKTTKRLIKKQNSSENSKNWNCNNTTYLPLNEKKEKKIGLEDKPTIEVTVVPREAETLTKVFNKHRRKTKVLQSTISNQESSIKSQNIYFMVKGKRREKVYEIKSSESTNFSNNFLNARYEDISLEQITNSKQLLSSLNMEKKKRKNKKIEQNSQNNYTFDGTSQIIQNYEESKVKNTRKSKVTIVGQLGLTQDDQYILKCAATVNDKPIQANYVELDNTNYKTSLNINRTRNANQDSNVQTDICYSNNCINLDSTNMKKRMISQATQVNFLQSNHKPFKAFQNKIAQCSFSTAENIVFNSGTQDIALSNGEKPLVVISVYPRHDSEDNNISPVNIIQHPTLSQKKVNNIDINTFKRKEKQQNKDSVISVNKTRQRSPRSKSPSPGSTHIQNKTIADKTVGRVLGNKNNNMHNISPPQRNVNKSGHKLIKPKKDTSCYCTYSMGLENKDLVELKRTPKAYDIKETDTTKVKRALVNHFLKSVDRIDPSDTKMKLVTPQNDTSRVTINIDGEKEHYDLFFEQNDFDTGLSVRKSKKKPPINGTSRNDVYKNSKENLLMLSDEKKNGTYMYSHEKNVKPKIEPMLTRLKVRDSLEICHSRDGRTGSRLNTNENRGQNDLTDSFFNVALIAPVKHYRGDGCLIPDPNERDKEIRVLLGIVRNTRSIEKEESVANKDLNVSYSHSESQDRKEKTCSCCIKRGSKSLVTGISISRSQNYSKRKKNTNRKIVITTKCAYEHIEKRRPQTSTDKQRTNVTEFSSDPQFNQLLTSDKQVNKKFTNENVFRQVPLESGVLIMNHNLRIEQLNQRKPIILTRKQYDKVKRTIRCIMKQHKCYNLITFNKVSIGEVKIKRTLQKIRCNREVQTEWCEVLTTDRCKNIQTQHNYKTKRRDAHDTSSKVKISGQRIIDKIIFPADTKNDKNIKRDMNEYVNLNKVTPRQADSMEICYAHAYVKHFPISATHFGDGLHNKITRDIPKPSTSLHTIFKGHRKTATPNLGTSAYSLCSDANHSTKSITAPPYAGDCKPKKLFLQKLLSCLVMQSTETTILKEVPTRKLSSVNSSVDSYHISSSLGALEMTSSLYDTSASFYSNHVIKPTNKLKRSFLSSVREFLSNRRS
ncbi:uncharacterized protein LOC120627806 isoform X1 [Pararge aegeria]|uniref:uncharacterized protein LOC120627806 isoform X1 n=1 Tax=Pararge aegeria TaxID=116150 RepID=UPI0019D1D540|nr:uncharacterized protein LOC120627806 isoform X1 [Pararge aegeria]